MTHATFDISIDRLDAFCRQNGIRRLSLFGSALRDDFTADSDIDLLVEFEPDARTGLAFFRMQRELSTMFGRRVDLNTPADLSPYYRDEVLSEAKVLYDAA
jgi:predicted nucleotidyltransferase